MRSRFDAHPHEAIPVGCIADSHACAFPPGDARRPTCCALAGDRAGTKPDYLKVCTPGVCVGCENLARVYEHGDDSIPDMLGAICAKDATHVAWDFNETTPWATLALSRAADELLRELERDAEADAELPAQAR